MYCPSLSCLQPMLHSRHQIQELCTPRHVCNESHTLNFPIILIHSYLDASDLFSVIDTNLYKFVFLSCSLSHTGWGFKAIIENEFDIAETKLVSISFVVYLGKSPVFANIESRKLCLTWPIKPVLEFFDSKCNFSFEITITTSWYYNLWLKRYLRLLRLFLLYFI